MEGIYCDYLEAQFRKPVILSGPIVPGQPTSALEKKWATWLDGFEAMAHNCDILCIGKWKNF